MSAEERAALTAASATAAHERREVREDAEESARLGVQALMGRALEERAERVVGRLVDLALSTDDATALRGIQLLLERVHGRAVSQSIDLTPERNPVVEAFASLTPDQRRALLSLAQPLPTDPDTASVQG